MRRIREARSEREEVALDLLEPGRDLRVRCARARQTDPRAQLVDIAVGRHARVALRHTRAVEQAGLARVARLRVNFHWPNYTDAQAKWPAAARFPAQIPVEAPLLVSRERARSAVAAHARSLSRPRVGGDAPADAGGPRAAEVRGVARPLPDIPFAGGGRRGGRGTHVAPARLQHPAAAPACDRARGGRAIRRRS